MKDQQTSGNLIPPGCGLWFSWLGASTIGSISGWIFGWWLSFQLPGNISIAVIGTMFGLVLGLLQWLVLKNHLKNSIWWIIASAAGWGAGFSLGVVIAQRLGLTGAWFGIMLGVVTGSFLGIFQWTVLRSQVTQAGWWVPASIFAWASSLLYYQPGINAMGAMYGILSGIVTGVVLLWLLYRPVADER